MTDRIKELLDRIGDEAEAAESMADPNAPLPEGTKVTRGHNRSRTLQVRLNGDEYEALERLAKAKDLPLSTVARSLLLNSLAPATDANASLARIEQELSNVRRILGTA